MFRIMAAVLAGVALMLAAGAAQGAEVVDEWLGAISVTPTEQLHLAVHIHAAPRF